MPTCIYCRAPTTGTESKPHAIPEALFANDYVLAPGAECESCNKYLGKLDSALVLHNHVWLGIQVLSLPGKNGKPRINMGWMQRSDPDHPQVLRIEGRGRNTLQIKDNRINIEMDAAPGWNLGRFRRSLHRLAFGYLALVHGSDYVLQEKFNPVRSYIRKPKSGEKWPYGETTISDKLIKRISIDFVDGESISIIQIQLFNAIFFIDLFHSANFPEWLKANNVTLK